jgi:F-type H+-transporting ATPase subunit delta
MAGAAARRYARAIFELAREEGRFDEWGERLAKVREVFAAPEVQEFLINPSIGREQREEGVQSLLGDRIGPEGVNLGKLLVGAGRVDQVDEIEREYQHLVDEAEGRVRAAATTAVTLPPEDYERLQSRLSKRMGKEVRLTADVDPAILGGLVLRIGDHVIDASLAARLRQLRRKLAGA